MKAFGIILIILGTLMIIYTGFHYITAEKVVDIGTVEVTRDKDHFIQWSPILGAGLLIVGIVLLLTGRKDRVQS